MKIEQVVIVGINKSGITWGQEMWLLNKQQGVEMSYLEQITYALLSHHEVKTQLGKMLLRIDLAVSFYIKNFNFTLVPVVCILKFW